MKIFCGYHLQAQLIRYLMCAHANFPQQTLHGHCDTFHKYFDILRCQILQYQNNGEIVIRWDLNARLGDLQDTL